MLHPNPLHEFLTFSQVTELLRAISDCSLTGDGWEALNKKKYFAVTLHTVLDWKLRSFVLCLRETPVENGGTVAGCFVDALADYGLTRAKVSAIVTDNASVMAAAVRQVGKPRVGCIAHICQLLIQKLVVVRYFR